QTSDPAPPPQRPFLRQTPEVRAVCGNAARTDLCGGPPARAVPTATTAADVTHACNATGQCRRLKTVLASPACARVAASCALSVSAKEGLPPHRGGSHNRSQVTVMEEEAEARARTVRGQHGFQAAGRPDSVLFPCSIPCSRRLVG